MFTQHDHKYWEAIPEITNYLLGTIGPKDRVLDIGPGRRPFPRSDKVVDFFEDFNHPKDKLVSANLCYEPLPFPDKSFDFIYCRHVLEDMFNPFLLVKEMERVGKAGYIECPSPLAEVTRGIDNRNSPAICGYHHHHWLVWNDDGVLKFATKYPVIEHFRLGNEEAGDAILKRSARYWNTYFPWKDKIPVKHLQNAIDFMMPGEYPGVIANAAATSIRAADRFFDQIGITNGRGGK